MMRSMPVDELGTKALIDGLRHVLRRKRCRTCATKPEPDVLPDHAAEIRRQDDDAVAEVHRVPAGVGQPAVVEDLQKQIPRVGMRFLELVEKHDRERLLAHAIGERVAPRSARSGSPTILRIDSTLWNSLMSSRISRSGEPNRNSASVLASSVLPVPVGPANRNTATGLLESVSPALSIAMRSTTASTASSWPMTRALKKRRRTARSNALAVVEHLLRHPGHLRHRRQHVLAAHARRLLREGALNGELEEIENGARHLTGAEIVTREVRDRLQGLRLDVDRRHARRSAWQRRPARRLISASVSGRNRTSSSAVLTAGRSWSTWVSAAGVISLISTMRPVATAGSTWSRMVALCPWCVPLAASCRKSGACQSTRFSAASSVVRRRRRSSSWPM